VLTAGLGGMGGAQPLAATMNGAVIIAVEVDPSRIRRRLETRYVDRRADTLDEAVGLARAASNAGSRCRSPSWGTRRISSRAWRRTASSPTW